MSYPVPWMEVDARPPTDIRTDPKVRVNAGCRRPTEVALFATGKGGSRRLPCGKEPQLTLVSWDAT
jgi:hypothetical protein